MAAALTFARNGPEVILGDASTGVERIVTDSKGVQFDPHGWLAPEFDGAPAVLTTVDGSEIWIYGIDGGAGRFVQRADDLGPGRVRHEAETYAGEKEVFLYYNELLPSGRFDLVRVRTGLKP